ncbi:hypothetical protein F2Q70_00038853 [Brassica cretica]|uniref:Uncharacterized protein n=1 Tax=Brassica cretica TaxID=69181 RepID=A0A8S9K3F7_BRACR|nr:hypothetical protein F2Q70_00038853 [Brassica cretica]KAF2620184.1 hypothetical protein F2Q68_00039541 [Brassica cretica]
MAVDEQNELPEATQREAELKRQLDGLQSQVTELHRAREESAEKLSQLEPKNLTLRDENQALNTASNRKCRIRTLIRPMPTLETPNSGGYATLPPMTSQGYATTRKKTKGARIYDIEDSKSEPEPDKEAPEESVIQKTRSDFEGSCHTWSK